MKSQQGVTQADAQLFFRAACCLISADGNIRSKEVATLSEAMNRLGFLHTHEQLRTLAVSTCKEIHAKGVDGESTALASQLSRLRATPLASYLQQTLLSLAASDGGVTEKEQRIASQLCDALVSSTPSGPPQLAASLQAKSVGPPPIGAKSRPQHQPKTAGSWHPLDWKWVFPILLVFFAVVRVRMAFLPAANDAKGRPNQPRATEARSAEARAAEARAAEARAAEARAAEARAAETRAAEARAAEARAAEARAAEARAAEARADEAKLLENAPTPDMICANADDTYEVIESKTETENGYTSKFVGKIIKVEGCWFNPLDNMELTREEAQEGVYLMSFWQGGERYSDGTRFGSVNYLYTADRRINFYVNRKQAQNFKDAGVFIKKEQEKLGIRFPESHAKYNFYFEIVDRKSVSRRDGLISPCAKLVFFESSQ